MKKKVMCMLLTGMMAASMIAGCGNSGNASANAGADTNTDASADAADSSADQSADVTPDTTAANSASAQPEILTTASISTLYPVRMVRYKRSIHRAVRCGREK